MRRKSTGVVLTTVAALFFSVAAFADPIVVTTTDDALVLANTLLSASSGIVINSATYTGASTASGQFSGGTGVIGVSSGIVLTTGVATFVTGPNTLPDAGVDNGADGDAALTTIVGTATQNASSLLIDFTPTANEISFSYVFGSEEYNDFVDSEFNDVFGFFVNGVNYALIPGTSTAVSINTVNNGFAFEGEAATGPCMNCAFFVDNAAIPGSPFNTELDGFTTALAFLAPVSIGVPNTLRLVIADTADGNYDSAVFLQGGSFQVGPPVVPPTPGVIPEPASLMLVGTGLAALYRRRSKSRKRA